MNYQEKYYKYKQKYLHLKKMYAGTLTRDTAIDPAFLKPHNHDDIADYSKIITKLRDILNTPSNKPDIFILKVGSNDIQSKARCDGGKCKHYIYNDLNQIILNGDEKKLMSLARTIGREKQNAPNIKMIQIDPMDETFTPFKNVYDDEESITIENILSSLNKETEINAQFIKEFFPLARNEIVDGQLSDTPSNIIIKLLVDYDRTLILYNAIGSQCYGIFKVIIDLRKLKKHKTIYGGVANDPITTDCEINNSTFILSPDNKVEPIPDTMGAINY
jgi:hypothetical protein